MLLPVADSHPTAQRSASARPCASRHQQGQRHARRATPGDLLCPQQIGMLYERSPHDPGSRQDVPGDWWKK